MTQMKQARDTLNGGRRGNEQFAKLFRNFQAKG